MARKRSKPSRSARIPANPPKASPPPPPPTPSAGSTGRAASDSGEGGEGGHARPDWWGLHLWQIQPIRDVLLIAGVVLLVQMGYALRIVTIPILVAMLVAYLFEPLVERITRLKWVSRQGATLLIIFSAAVIVVAPLTIGLGFAAVQTTQLARSLSTNIGLVRKAGANAQDETALAETMDRLPNEGWRSIAEYWIELQQQIEGGQAGDAADAAALMDAPVPPPQRPSDIGYAVRPIPWNVLEDHADRPQATGIEDNPDDIAAALRAARVREARSAEFGLLQLVINWIEAHTNEIVQHSLATGRGAVGLAIGTAGGLGVFLFQGFLTAFFFYFFSTGWGKVQEFWSSLIPERRKGFVIDLLKKMDAVIAGFIRGRLLIGVILAIYFTIAYWLIGVPAPLVLGPITGVLCLVPYVGIVSVPAAIITMWLSPSPWFAFQTTWWWMVFAPIVVYNAGQFFDDYVLTPQIQGKSTNMDIPSILFATIAGGAVAGIYGLLLAIPVAACIKILMQEIFWPKFRAWATGKAKDFLPIDRN
ncbi:MAG: AI-2E family transporter [Phycisphaerales bacterium]